jgi:hypothetical protein
VLALGACLLQCGLEYGPRGGWPLVAGRCGAGQDDAANQVGPLLDDDLGDHAAQGEAQQVDRAQPERIQKRHRVGGHGFDAVGGGAAGAADTPEVDQDDAPLGGQAVDHGGVPVVEYRGEVVQEHDRNARVRAHLAVGERGPLDFHRLGDSILAS